MGSLQRVNYFGLIGFKFCDSHNGFVLQDLPFKFQRGKEHETQNWVIV